MEVKFTEEEKNYIISIDGDLDASSSIKLDKVLAKAIGENRNPILVDCNRLDYISSPGIGVFTSHLQECESRNISLVLYGMNDKVLKVFRILGLDEIIPITKTKDEAKSRAK
jgi:anti-sigma B factor antagonist